MRKLPFIIVCIAAVLATLPFPDKALSAQGEEIIRAGEVLNLDRCIQIALLKQPSILAAYFTVEANRSRVGEALSNYYPQIGASGGYSRYSSPGISTEVNNMLFGTGYFNEYTNSLTLSQNIYDFGKTSSQVKIQKFNLDSAGSDLETTKEQIVLNVKQTYYTVIQAARNRAVADEAVGQYKQHLDQAKGFFDVGTKPRYDVITAEVNLSNAKLNLISADNALKIARVNLNNAMGVPDAPAYTVEDSLDFTKYVITLDDALSRAMANRPDIKSLVLRRKAAEESVQFAKTGYYPALTGSASYNWQGGTGFPLESEWNVGV
ncbi:MAG TPA: TolC family protein, partial [Dissulfurispiraceae bacterium]|nr:TolC family protein [Dissulfurispiraceae bacterium]